MNRSFDALKSSYTIYCEANKVPASRILIQQDTPKFLRYPGGKGRLLSFLTRFLPQSENMRGRYIEPFVGGGAVYLHQNPPKALISDINPDLIDLYKTIQLSPIEIWDKYCGMPATKQGYYEIRGLDPTQLDAPTRAARLLYLNRTCFKGMWRQNKKGQFNIGYGGQSRRWVITKQELLQVSTLLQKAEIKCSDFEPILDDAKRDDFVFLDPPYRPGFAEMSNSHYCHNFVFLDQVRLAHCLAKASSRQVPWVITNSAHPNVLRLYENQMTILMPVGTGERPGLLTDATREVVVLNKAAFKLLAPGSRWSVMQTTLLTQC